MAKFFIFSGSLLAFFAVGFGAFAAHGLKSMLSAELISTFQTGVQYNMYHALGIILAGIILIPLKNNTLINSAGILFLIGILLFSGSLYVICFTGINGLGLIMVKM